MNPKQKQPKPQKYKRNDLVVVKEGAELINRGEVLEYDVTGVVLGYNSKGYVVVTTLSGYTFVVEESYVAPNQERR